MENNNFNICLEIFIQINILDCLYFLQNLKSPTAWHTYFFIYYDSQILLYIIMCWYMLM